MIDKRDPEKLGERLRDLAKYERTTGHKDLTFSQIYDRNKEALKMVVPDYGRKS